MIKKYRKKPVTIEAIQWTGTSIPYNEETKHLLGTTDEWKGGK